MTARLDERAESFLLAMRERFACKLYDGKRSVPEEIIDYILECGRLSPSSFGIEHWRFFAITTPNKIASMKEACFDQDAVGTATLVVAIMCRRSAAYDPDGEFIARRGERFPGGLSVFVDDFRGYYEYLRGEGILDQWARAQCYIPCANMMTAAKAAGIDSCAIEGFHDGKVVALLDLDPVEWQTGIIVSFGYSAESGVREKIRMPKGDIITRV
ncbi:MAG TPA: nitroreductase family protein [Treponemataceae bacterium]|nr:nitroreductase family protein [Treponemataceae bacterium]